MKELNELITEFKTLINLIQENDHIQFLILHKDSIILILKIIGLIFASYFLLCLCWSLLKELDYHDRWYY